MKIYRYALPLAWVLTGLMVFGSCGGVLPPIPPPIPPPDPTHFIDMLLRSDGPSAFQTIEGERVTFKGAISCCMPNEDWGGEGAVSGWPVNFAPDWQDYAGARYNTNFFHGRLGPFLKGGTAFDAPWDDVGGPYLTVSGEKVDLNSWNPGYWNLIKTWIEYAGERGRYVEIDIIDGWYCKHANWGDAKMPWMAEYNIQGENHVATCSSAEIVEHTLFDTWVRKVVTEFGPYGNVIWQDGNEIGITGQYQPRWSLSMRDRVRYWEKEVGYGVVHLFGTNSNHPEVMSQVDYIEGHRKSAWTEPQFGRISMVNEYNLNPPKTPQEMQSDRCNAQKSGTFWWYWRHGQSIDDMNLTLSLFDGSCPAMPEPQCTTAEDCNCWVGTGWKSCPDPGCKTSPKAGIYWLWKNDARWTADATPKKCAFCFCKQFNHCMTPDRQCCPVACEGDPTRLEKEQELMGGDAPVWTLKVTSGTLEQVPDPWKGVVKGSGTGTIHWCFPNGKACSEKLPINK